MIMKWNNNNNSTLMYFGGVYTGNFFHSNGCSIQSFGYYKKTFTCFFAFTLFLCDITLILAVWPESDTHFYSSAHFVDKVSCSTKSGILAHDLMLNQNKVKPEVGYGLVFKFVQNSLEWLLDYTIKGLKI